MVEQDCTSLLVPSVREGGQIRGLRRLNSANRYHHSHHMKHICTALLACAWSRRINPLKELQRSMLGRGATSVVTRDFTGCFIQYEKEPSTCTEKSLTLFCLLWRWRGGRRNRAFMRQCTLQKCVIARVFPRLPQRAFLDKSWFHVERKMKVKRNSCEYMESYMYLHIGLKAWMLSSFHAGRRSPDLRPGVSPCVFTPTADVWLHTSTVGVWLHMQREEKLYSHIRPKSVWSGKKNRNKPSWWKIYAVNNFLWL